LNSSVVSVRHSVAHGPAKDQRADNRANHTHQGHLTGLRMRHAIRNDAANQRPNAPAKIAEFAFGRNARRRGPAPTTTAITAPIIGQIM
jgi:hypothetical protein